MIQNGLQIHEHVEGGQLRKIEGRVAVEHFVIEPQDVEAYDQIGRWSSLSRSLTCSRRKSCSRRAVLYVTPTLRPMRLILSQPPTSSADFCVSRSEIDNVLRHATLRFLILL